MTTPSRSRSTFTLLTGAVSVAPVWSVHFLVTLTFLYGTNLQFPYTVSFLRTLTELIVLVSEAAFFQPSNFHSPCTPALVACVLDDSGAANVWLWSYSIPVTVAGTALSVGRP